MVISLGDVFVQGWTYNCFFCRMHRDLYVVVCRLSFKCWCSFFRLGVLVWWLLSLWPCVSLPVYHQDTSSLLELWRAVLPLPQTGRHTSLAIPSLKYLHGSVLTKTAAASKHGWGCSLVCGPTMVCLMWVELSFRPSPHLSSSVVFGHLSSTGFKKPSGMFIRTRGWTAPLMDCV